MSWPHQGGLVLMAGVPLDQARAALIMLHGRGGSAHDTLEFAREFDADGIAYLAPEAAGNSWWPQHFTASIESNEPYFSSALAQVALVINRVTRVGVPLEAIALLGFSQGACLALEFAARSACRYGGVVALSGGLFGPPGTPREYPGSFDGTPVFIGCSDIDPHIPRERLEESAAVFEKMSADVTMRLYPGMGHTINTDEIDFIRGLVEAVTHIQPSTETM